MTDFDQIWKDANECYDELNESAKTETESLCSPSGCKHTNVVIYTGSNEGVCEDCGLVVEQADFISQEWACYTDDAGKMSSNNQRGEVISNNNIYENPCSMFRYGEFANKRSLINKLQCQISFNHKQKMCWEVSQKFNHVGGLFKHNKDIITQANNFWLMCMKANVLTRASVRAGLIAMCYYYSCIQNNLVVDRSKICEYFDCRNTTKGEKVFCGVIEKDPRFRYLTQKELNLTENDSFVFYCNKLGLAYNIAMKCNDFFETHKNKFKGVTPKTVTAGIIVYIIKTKLNLKNPTKSEISKTVNVCIPTLNKVIKMIETFETTD